MYKFYFKRIFWNVQNSFQSRPLHAYCRLITFCNHHFFCSWIKFCNICIRCDLQQESRSSGKYLSANSDIQCFIIFFDKVRLHITLAAKVIRNIKMYWSYCNLYTKAWWRGRGRGRRRGRVKAGTLFGRVHAHLHSVAETCIW